MKDIGPLMPLVPGDPLTLSPELHQTLYAKDQAAENQAIFAAHTFPWVWALIFLLLILAFPVALAYWRRMCQPQAQPPLTLEDLIKQMEQLPQLSETRCAAYQLAELFKSPFQDILGAATTSLTFQEILTLLEKKRQFSKNQLNRIQKQFELLDALRFDAPQPTQAQIAAACRSSRNILQEISISN